MEALASGERGVRPARSPESVQGAGLKAVSLSLCEAGQLLRLSHAIVYASCQGLTIQGLVRLRDVRHHRFTKRMLLVGISRATAAANVEVGL